MSIIAFVLQTELFNVTDGAMSADHKPSAILVKFSIRFLFLEEQSKFMQM